MLDKLKALSAIDPDALRKTLDRILLIGGVVAKLTPTQIDDTIVATLKGLVDEPGLLEALLKLIGQ